MRRLFQLTPMEPTLGDRITRALLVVFFLGIASVAAVLCWAFPRQDRLATERSERLLETQGKVTTTEIRAIRTRRGSTKEWQVTVWYTFEVAGRIQVGNRVDFSHREASFVHEPEAVAFREQHPDGKSVTIWYDREDPADSALGPAWVPVTFLVLPAAAVGALALLAGLLTLRDTLRQVRKQPLPAAEVRRGLAAIRNFGVLLGGSAAVLLLVHTIPQLRHASLRGDLVTGDVTVTTLEVQGDPPVPAVAYFFRPSGQEALQHGASWRFGRLAVRTWEEGEAVTASLRRDYQENRLRVHYLKSDPSRNALSPEHGGVLASGLVLASGIALALAAPLGALAGLALRRLPAPAPSRRW